MTIPQDQNSPEWHEWRKKGIGASDVPIILGNSKWCTPYVLWQRKLGFVDGVKDNYAMQRGRQLEPMVRDLVNTELKANFKPLCVAHSELSWALASLDGIDTDKGAVLEIKCPGLEDHQCAERDEIPKHYFPQVQWQLFCADLKTAYYASYYQDEMKIVTVERDDEYLASILSTVSEFYRCMIEFEEPAKGEDDFVYIDDDEFLEYAREWKAAQEMAKIYADKEKYFKNKLISLTDDSNCKGGGITMKRVAREGSVDWKKRWDDVKTQLPQADEAYPIEEYRKEQIGYWKITVDK